ncbi:unnamed protein product, partial [Effrenium voratum]
ERFEVLEATKYSFDCGSGRWEQHRLTLRLTTEPFAEGGMRLCYRCREISEDGWEVDKVVKRIKPHSGLDPTVNYHEAMTQMVAESYAQDFNKACCQAGLPNRIAFLPVSVIKLDGYQEPLCLEPYLDGDYVKHSDNAGHRETDDETAAAFSYFSYIVSGAQLVVCDIQGVGTFYTDPQIHTADGQGFGAGNLGAEGIRRFLHSHRHSLLSEQLGLPSPDEGLSDEELARKIQALEREDAARGNAAAMVTLIPGLSLTFSTMTTQYSECASQYNEGFTAIAKMFGKCA